MAASWTFRSQLRMAASWTFRSTSLPTKQHGEQDSFDQSSCATHQVGECAARLPFAHRRRSGLSSRRTPRAPISAHRLLVRDLTRWRDDRAARGRNAGSGWGEHTTRAAAAAAAESAGAGDRAGVAVQAKSGHVLDLADWRLVDLPGVHDLRTDGRVGAGVGSPLLK